MTTVQLSLFPELDDAVGCVYFGLALDGRIKIGSTCRPIKYRGGELRIRVLLTIPGGELDEHRYHRRYKAERINGSEWFHPTNRLLLDLHALCAEHGQNGSAQLIHAILTSRLSQAVAA